jgi:hypothetical protein
MIWLRNSKQMLMTIVTMFLDLENKIFSFNVLRIQIKYDTLLPGNPQFVQDAFL